MKFLRLNPKKNKAQAIVEFALVLPILLLVVYGLIEAGRFIFIISSVNNATRQAARYGSTSGVGPNGTARYMDCVGIRAAAQNADFLNAFDDADITIEYDRPTPTDADPAPYATCSGGNIAAITGDRVTVSINYDYNAIVPAIVPFLSRVMNAESSRTLLLTINILPPGEPTETNVATSPNPSQIGQYVTVTVTVNPITPGTTPTGDVIITGADENCVITLSGGTGSCTVRFLSAGTKSVSASYVGDTDHAPSSGAASHEVKRYPTITKITADTPDPSLANQTISVTVTVTSPNGTPTGTVNVDACAAPVTLTNGTGSCGAVYTSTGRKTLTAGYSGDANFDVSSDTERHDVVLPNETVTIIQSHAPDPSEVGRSVTIMVTVAGVDAAGNPVIPTGTVDITGADTNCSFTLASGSGNCVVVFNSVGSKTIAATYSGDANNQGSSDSVIHSVELAATTTAITTVSPEPSQEGGSVTVTVTVTGGMTTPTGNVGITTAAGNFCTITLSGGTGSCTGVFSSPGTKTLVATYPGDGAHAASDDSETHVVAETALTGCNTLNYGLLDRTNGTLTFNITNPYTVPLRISELSLKWNHDDGHKTGSDKTLALQSANINGVVFFTSSLVPGEPGESKTIVPNPQALIQPGPATITFTFHQSFDKWDNTESLTIHWDNPGCEVDLVQNQNTGR